MKLLRAGYLAVLIVFMAACGSDESQSLDPMATYDVYGEAFEPGIAVPATAVVVEPETYVGRKVIIEGVALDGCADRGCLTTIAPGLGGQIDVFLPSEEGDAFEVPGDITGRRIVVSGSLEELASPTQEPSEGADAVSPRDMAVPEMVDTLQNESDARYRLNATGIMVEKARP